MNVRTTSAGLLGVLALALAVGSASLAAAPSPLPPFTVLPARVGTSVSFHYDANESSPRGATATHAVVTLTRVVGDRVVVTVAPDDGPPFAIAGRVQGDGELRFDLADAAARGARTGRVAVPTGVGAIVALAAGRTSASPGARTWTFPAFPAGASGVVGMTAKLDPREGGANVVADGSADVEVPGPVPSPGPSSAPQRGRGGFGGPGGFGGGYGRRRGGDGEPGGEPGAAAMSVPTVPATIALHVECTFRGARLELARGVDTTSPKGAGTAAPATVRWTLTPL